jgi:hypothetical protein
MLQWKLLKSHTYLKHLHMNIECTKVEQVNHTFVEVDPVGRIGGNCGGDCGFHYGNGSV